MFLVAVLDPAKNLDRLLDRRLFNHDRLEATLKCRISLDVLAIVIQRRRADRLELAACEGWLEDVGRVDGAFGSAGAYEHVQLVDKQHAVARALDLFHDLLQALLELAAILGASDQGANVERQQSLALQRFGHITRGDVLSQALDDRRLAHAGLADQDRVVLGSAGKNLHHSLDFFRAANHRIQRSRSRRSRKIKAQTGRSSASEWPSVRLSHCSHRRQPLPLRGRSATESESSQRARAQG